MIGSSIGGYQVVRKLGEGGMGVVYVGVHPQLGHEVAIKLLLPEFSSQPDIVQRFFNEARAATQLTHPGIIRVFDCGQLPGGAAYFVMEMLHGESLAARLRSRRVLTAHEALTITRQAAGALGAAHERGIIHRDIKPDNLFLVPDPDLPGGERVKVLDFGIAKLIGDPRNLVRTRTGSVMGTPYYMSPEQCRGAPDVDARGDIYSLGCVLFEMTCGRPPFLGEGVGEILGAHQFLAAPDPAAMNPSLPPSVAQIIRRAMAKAPHERQASMRELADQCAAALTSGPAPVVAPVSFDTTLSSAAAQTAPRGPGRSKLPFAIGGGVVLAGGVTAAILLAGGGGGGAHAPATVRDAAAAAPPGDRPSAPVDAATGIPDGWAMIAAPSPPVLEGVRPELYPHGKVPDDAPGFRPARNVMTPREPFLIQLHEVTWGELAAARPDLVPSKLRVPGADAELPASAISWSDAMAYCTGLGGSLPTEEQWELAARGPERRPNPWGDKQLDRLSTHAFAGADATPLKVGSSPQDRTPSPDGRAIVDLAGNVQEWTADLWREDSPGQDESWVQSEGLTFRAIRGLPLVDPPPATLPIESAAYREPLCATGACPDDTAPVLAHVGFRCARPWHG